MTIPLPAVSSVTAPFWDACRRGVLQVQRCQSCGHNTFPPDVACNKCLSAALVWSPCSGAGTVMSYSIVRRPAQPAFKVPFVAAIVQTHEGWPLFTNIIDCPPEQVEIGMQVEVRFVEMSAEISLPYFAPVGSERADKAPLAADPAAPHAAP